MEEKKEKGNFWLTVATFIVNKRKAFLVLFAIACIYCAACMNKVSVNQDITKYLPADSETRIGLTLMDEQFMTYGSARIMVSNITWQDADALVSSYLAVSSLPHCCGGLFSVALSLRSPSAAVSSYRAL